MIYEFERNGLIEQGDILKNLPRIPLENYENWENYVRILNSKSDLPPPLELTFMPIITKGVLLTQSCDIRKGEMLIFGELIEKEFKAKSLNGETKEIKKIVRDDTRFHFFPHDETKNDLQQPMTLDFRKIFTIPFDVIVNNYDDYFIARLKKPLIDVLKEKISRYFTRLAFEDVYFYTNEQILFLINKGDLDKVEVSQNLLIIGRDTTFLDE